MRRSNRVLLNDHSCQLIPNLVAVVGNRSTAVILQEIHYWLTAKSAIGVIHDNQKWVYNTYEYISEKTGYSLSAIKLSLKTLQNLGLIFVKKLNPVRSIRTNYYTINYDHLNQILDKAKAPHLSENNKSSSSTHQSLMTQSSVTYCPMYNKEQRYLTDTFNKSELFEPTESGEGDRPNMPTSSPSSKQVQRVAINIFSKEEKGQKVGTENPEEKTTKRLKDKTAHPNPVNTTAQDMLKIWNQTLEKAPTKMSKTLAPHLVFAYKNKFACDLKKWEKYCTMIASSAYLMGEGFTLSLLWALKFSTIDRILAGDFGVRADALKDTSPPKEILEKRAFDHIHGVDEPELCKEVRLKLLTLYGAATYVSWIQNLTFSLYENQVRFKAPSPFHESYVVQKFSQILR